MFSPIDNGRLRIVRGVTTIRVTVMIVTRACILGSVIVFKIIVMVFTGRLWIFREVIIIRGIGMVATETACTGGV